MDFCAEDHFQRRREAVRLSGTKTPTYDKVLEPGIIEEQLPVGVVVVETRDRLGLRGPHRDPGHDELA